MMMTDNDQNQEYYNYDAWGEHYDSSSLPASENRMRYIGARVECFVNAEYEKDAIYELGVRHYWPNLCRFLQRDPNTYTKLPAPSNPKSVNPYIYADNNPVTKLDPSGYAAGQVRGARMGGASFQLGGNENVPADQIYDCCGPQGFYALSDMTLEFSQYEINIPGVGIKSGTYGEWSGKEGLGLCEMKPEQAQPTTPACPKWTTMSSDLACTYLSRCKGASCGNPFTGSNQSCGGGGCILGFSPYNYGFESDAQNGFLQPQEEQRLKIIEYVNELAGIFYNEKVAQITSEQWSIENPNKLFYWGPTRDIYGFWKITSSAATSLYNRIFHGQWTPFVWQQETCHQINRKYLYEKLDIYARKIGGYWEPVLVQWGPTHSTVYIKPKGVNFWYAWARGDVTYFDFWADPDPSDPVTIQLMPSWGTIITAPSY